MNEFYNTVCISLYNYENSLYSVSFTDLGIKCKYFTPILTRDGTIKYLQHVWNSRYFGGEDADYEILASKKIIIDRKNPFIDGFGRLVTSYLTLFKSLNAKEKAFVKRKSSQKLEKNLEGSNIINGSWKINNNQLSGINKDWRLLLPGFGVENKLFLELPTCYFDPKVQFLDDVPQKILPFGEFYGLSSTI